MFNLANYASDNFNMYLAMKKKKESSEKVSPSACVIQGLKTTAAIIAVNKMFYTVIPG